MNMCDDAVEMHKHLIDLPLPEYECKRQKYWFKSKMGLNNQFLSNVKQWLSVNDDQFDRGDLMLMLIQKIGFQMFLWNTQKLRFQLLNQYFLSLS